MNPSVQPMCGAHNEKLATRDPAAVFFSGHAAIPRLVPADSPVQCVADVHAVLGEGPVWVARETALYWLDIKGQKIFRLGDDGQVTQWPTPLRVGPRAPRRNGAFIGGTKDETAIINPTADRFELICRPEEHLRDNRFNDGKLDRRGR